MLEFINQLLKIRRLARSRRRLWRCPINFLRKKQKIIIWNLNKIRKIENSFTEALVGVSTVSWRWSRLAKYASSLASWTCLDAASCRATSDESWASRRRWNNIPFSASTCSSCLSSFLTSFKWISLNKSPPPLLFPSPPSVPSLVTPPVFRNEASSFCNSGPSSSPSLAPCSSDSPLIQKRKWQKHNLNKNWFHNYL